MKLIVFIPVICLVFFFSSCKKEYYCTCISQNNESTEGTKFVAKEYNEKKAKEKCELMESLANDPSTICTLSN